MEYKEGVYRIDSKTYHSDPCPEPSLSRSTIVDLIFKSPAHAKFNHPRLNPFYKEEKSEKFDLGSAAHALLLEGDEKIAIISADNWRKKETKTDREEARNSGLIPLLADQYTASKNMVAAAEKALAECSEIGINNLRGQGDSELSWICNLDGAWIRTRPDWISHDRSLIIDYKTTEMSASPDNFARLVISNGLDIQCELYCRAVEKIAEYRPKFVFMVQESYEPYLCSFVALPPAFMDMAKSKVDYGIWLWKRCRESGIWEGYPNRVAWIEPPQWALNAWEYKATSIGLGESDE